MFDFEKLEVYKKAKLFNAEIRSFISSNRLYPSTKDQLRRASFSIVLNLAEGSGRFVNLIDVISLSFREVQYSNVWQYWIFWKMKIPLLLIYFSHFMVKLTNYQESFMQWLRIFRISFHCFLTHFIYMTVMAITT